MTVVSWQTRSLARHVARWRADEGSVSIVGVAAGLVTVIAGSSVALASVYVISRAEARGAADLAALAGARWVRAGQNVACARAAEIVTTNHAVMVSCLVEGMDIELTVEVKGIQAVARAGPVRTMGGPDAA